MRLKGKVEKEAIRQAEAQGIFKDAGIDDPSHAYHGDKLAYALKRTAFYQCYDCKEPYFGGLVDCMREAQNAEQAETKKEDLKCQKCLLKDLGAG